MRTFFYTKTVIALAVAVAAATAVVSQTQAQQPAPSPTGGSALPADIDPSSPLAQVVKLTQAGMSADVIRNYIATCPGTFNLDAGKIVELNDVGVPTDIVNAMMDHDKNISAPAAAVAPPPPVSSPEAAPAQDVSLNYFDDTLTPYGSWVVIEGYGRCWRPTTVIYDSAWQPYCDRGHWVYSDCGWFWNSDYAWGATFHYGRWFRHAQFGWCWWPDTVWAPSWVTWRSSSDYCGWAPLPPFTVYRPGIGFLYRGASVAVGFDFGLEAGCFTFVSPDHFCEHNPRYFRVERERVPEIFHRTTIVNNYNVHDRVIVNGGISVDRFNAGGRRPIQPVAVAQIPNAGRQGWHGNEAGGNNQLRHGPELRNEPNNSAPAFRQPGRDQPERVQPTPNHNFNENSPVRPSSPAQPGNRSGLREETAHNPVTTPNPGTHSSPPANSAPPIHSQPVSTPPAASRESPRNYSGETPGRYNPPAVTPAPERSQPAFNPPPVRNPQPQSPPVVVSPRNSPPPAPAAPAPAPSAPRSSGSSDKDRQNH
jgi:hypothetical protein